MKVLEVTDFYYPWIAGPAPLIQNLSLGLAERGHEVTVACPSPTGKRYTESGRITLHRVRTAPVPFGYRLRAGFPVIDLIRLVRSMRPDVVHIHHPFPISVAGLIAARVHRIPVVATNHTIPDCTLFGLRENRLYGPASFALSRYISWLLNQCDGVAVPTATAAEMLRELGYGREILPISNGVDTDRFHPAASPPSGPPVILYTGRLDDDKDMETMVRALPSVLNGANVRVRIGGEGTARTRLERMVSEMGIADRVSFTGYVANEDLPQVYREASVYCITSQVELQSISTLEAMASGLPVVAVAAGALPELVRTGMNGALVAPGDSEAVAAALSEIVGDEDLRTRYGRASRNVAEAHSVGAMISQYEQMLYGVVQRAAPRPAYGAPRG